MQILIGAWIGFVIGVIAMALFQANKGGSDENDSV